MTWTLNKNTYTLTLTCAGSMPTFSSSGSAPWYALKKYVHTAVIENGATTVSDNAFYGCDVMTSVTIPDSVTSIGDEAFRGCSSLTSVTIPDGVMSIGYGAFSYCSLTSVTIPDGVTSIGGSAFAYCSSLTSVTIGNSVTSIGYRVFSGCSSLTSVTIPNSVTSIGEEAFSGCSALTSVTIPNSVTRIRDYAFQCCSSLTSVEIPASVRQVFGGAFSGCTALEAVYFYNRNCSISTGATPANATVYGYAGSTAQTYADNNGLLFMEIDGHEHHYTVTKEVPATCTEDGSRNLACPCGDRTTETIPATGHTAVNVPAKDATCTEGGYAAWSYCEVCGETLTEKVETAPNGHTPAVTGAVAATCGAAGFTGVTYCSVCKEVLNEGEVIGATGAHTPGEAVETVVIAPACTATGAKKTTVKCTVCGQTLSEDITPLDALGHTDRNGDGRCDRCNAQTGEETGNTGSRPGIFDSIRQFFQRILAFFKNLFKIN